MPILLTLTPGMCLPPSMGARAPHWGRFFDALPTVNYSARVHIAVLWGDACKYQIVGLSWIASGWRGTRAVEAEAEVIKAWRLIFELFGYRLRQ